MCLKIYFPEHRDDVGIVPYDIAKDFLSVLCANGDEISTVCVVIVST